MTRQTKVLRFFVLVMAEITIGLSAVMAVFVRVMWLNVSGFLSEFYRLAMAAQAFFHRYRFGIFLVLVTLGTINTLTDMQLS